MANTETTKKLTIVLQYAAAVVLIAYAVFRFMIPVIIHKPVYLDLNDGLVIGGCLGLILVTEAFKKLLQRKIDKF